MYEKFKKLLDEHNVSTYKVSQETGIPYTCFSDWKSGVSKPKIDKLLKLAKYFNVSVEYFIEQEA